MSRFTNLRKHLGFREAFTIYQRLKKHRLNDIRIQKLTHPFSMRNNPFDYATFEEVILQESYHIDIDFIPKYIIDGGGNIGLTAAYFASKYPQAQIITIEPDDENYGVLQKNISPYSHISGLHKGIWHKEGWLKVIDGGTGNNSFTVTHASKATENAIEAVTIDGIMHSNNWPHIDILKLDIEGTEKELFSSGYEAWLSNTRVLIIELHDRMKKGCSKAVFSAISRYNFSCFIAGENLIFVNQNDQQFTGQ